MSAMRAGWNHFWKGRVMLCPDFVLRQKEKSQFGTFLRSAGEKSLFIDLFQRLPPVWSPRQCKYFSSGRGIENRSLKDEEVDYLFIYLFFLRARLLFFFREVKTFQEEKPPPAVKTTLGNVVINLGE